RFLARVKLPDSATDVENWSAVRLVLLIAGAFVAGAGGCDMYQANHLGVHQNISVDQLNVDEEPRSLYCNVVGNAMHDSVVTYGRNKTAQYNYIPLFSGKSDVRASGVHVFARIPSQQSSSADEYQTGSFEGVLERNNLPTPVRRAMERDHVLKG